MADIARLEAMRARFKEDAFPSFSTRLERLQKLKEAILHFEEELNAALFKELKKSPEEVWATETGLVIAELNNTIRHLRRWMRPEHVPTNLLNFPSRSAIWREPLGVVLIIGPWNYPVNLLFTPLVGAIAAGNSVMLKPSEYSPATNAVMQSIIRRAFDPEVVDMTEGEGSAVIPSMLNNFTFNHIFYTGSTHVGRIIYEMAAARLVPVTLELGGKSPCVVDADANLAVAARRIVMTKFSNAGQMCVAPDYLLVHESVKEKLLENVREAINRFFGDNPSESPNYGKIINTAQFQRLRELLKEREYFTGGGADQDSLVIEPTVLDKVNPDERIMKEEIFGPVLPVIAFRSREEALNTIQKNADPLAFYVYTDSRKNADEWIKHVPAGGCCVNNSSWHLTNHHLPFGGRGLSGTGMYHGKFSFDTFSHRKAVMRTPTWFDPAIKYPPFKGKLKLFKWLIR